MKFGMGGGGVGWGGVGDIGFLFVAATACSLSEWCFIISIDTHWDWFQHIHVFVVYQFMNL